MGWKFWQHDKTRGSASRRSSSSSSKSKSKSKSKSRARNRDRQPWDPKRTLQGAQALGTVAAVITAALLWHHGKAALERHAARYLPAEITADHVELTDPPPWMSDARQRRVRGVVARYVNPDPFDGRSLSIAAEALEADPVVLDVHGLRRLADGRVRVAASYRAPLAVVASEAGYHLVDREGVVLPGVFRRGHLSKVGLPVIVGVSTQPPSRPGGTWSGAGVEAGLPMAATLRGEPFADEVKAIDVRRRRGGYVDIDLLTPDGPVRWGRPPGQAHAVEAEDEVKLKRLRRLAAQAGSIALPGKLVEVNGPRSQSILIHMLPESERPRAVPAF